MPNRIIKESVCTSDNIDQLSPLAETFFYRLTVNCDDYGRADGRPSVLLAKCFPLKVGSLTQERVAGLLVELFQAGLVILYRNGREYLQLKTWDSHQQVRSKRSKYPGPKDPGSEIIDDIKCYQLLADDSICSRYPIQSNPIRIQSESVSESNLHALSDESDPEVADNVVVAEVKRKTTDPEGPTPTALTWRAYRAAYERRHGSAPPWNAATAGKLRSFVSRVPAEEAPQIAEFYLTHNDAFYVKSLHPVGLLLRDAEKIRTEWVTGRKMTASEARSAENLDHYQSQLERIKRGEL